MNDASSENPEAKNEAPPRKKSFRKPWVFIVGTILLAVLLYFGGNMLARSMTHESTDDAFLDTHFASIAPKVAGLVSAVHVRDNEPVQKGDLLLEIDPSDFQARLTQKRAAAASQEANFKSVTASYALIQARVKTAEAAAKQAKAEADAAGATAERTSSELKRAENLRERNVISAQEFDNAKAAADAAQANLNAALEKTASEESKVNEMRAQLEAAKSVIEMAQAQARQAEADQKLAELELSYSKITAPTNGVVTQKRVTRGDYVQIGQNLLAIVPTNFWVTANFKETQLTKIRVGQPVEIEIDSVAGRQFRGHVESIQSGSGARFSLLPPENAVGNFVKVVQRVPVKILFDEPLQAGHTLGPGLSVIPTVQTNDWKIPAVALAIGAVVLAFILALFVWKITKPDKES